jgi:hypothetical protein
MSGFCLFSCQDFDYPELGPIIPDPPYDPLKMYFPYEDNSVADKSIYNFLTTASDVVSFTPGVTGDAMQGGNGAYYVIGSEKGASGINMIDSIANTESFTISFWIYLEKAQATGGVALFAVSDTLAKDWVGNMEILIDGVRSSDNAVPFTTHIKSSKENVGDIWAASNNNPNVYLTNVLDKWTHIVIRYSGRSSTLSYFRDGEIVMSKQYPDFGSIAFQNVGKMAIGAFQCMTVPKLAKDAVLQGWEKNFPGKLDQFRFYNKFLTDRDVINLYNSKQ